MGVVRAWGLFLLPLTAEERGHGEGRQKVCSAESWKAPQQVMFLPASPQYKGGSSLGGTLSIQQTLCSHLSRIKERCEKIKF